MDGWQVALVALGALSIGATVPIMMGQRRRIRRAEERVLDLEAALAAARREPPAGVHEEEPGPIEAAASLGSTMAGALVPVLMPVAMAAIRAFTSTLRPAAAPNGQHEVEVDETRPLAANGRET